MKYKNYLSIIVALGLFQNVLSHGAMVEPRGRGCVTTNSLSIPDIPNSGIPADHCPHCQNAGGKDAVIDAAGNNWREYEPLNRNVPFRKDAGLCGDPIKDAKPRAHERGGTFGPSANLPFVANYVQDQIIEFTIDVTTNHNGFFEFFICDVAQCGGEISEDCFMDGHCHQLKRVPTPECESQTSTECGPIDPAFDGRWYVPCRQDGEHFMGGKYMKYSLPAGFSSNQAVIQWYWASANSCNPPGFIDYFSQFSMPGWGSCPGDGGAQGGKNPMLSTCGGTQFPEEFWTCADVTVARSGSPTTAQRRAPVVQVRDTDDSDEEEEKKEVVVTPKRITPTPSPAPKNKNRRKRATMKRKKSSKRGKCAQNWHPCGGMYHDGPTSCCSSNYKCIRKDKYYSQCVDEQQQ